MEFLLQYLDDLDDLYGMLGLAKERIIRAFLKTITVSIALVVAVASMVLAQLHTPLALATLTLLVVTLMYRVVTVSAPSNQAI